MQNHGPVDIEARVPGLASIHCGGDVENEHEHLFEV